MQSQSKDHIISSWTRAHRLRDLQRPLDIISLVTHCTDGKPEVQRGQSPTKDHQSKAGAGQASSPLSSHRGPGQEWPLGEALLAPPTASLSEASPAITAGFHKVGTPLMTSEGLRMKNSDEKAFKR